MAHDKYIDNTETLRYFLKTNMYIISIALKYSVIGNTFFFFPWQIPFISQLGYSVYYYFNLIMLTFSAHLIKTSIED